jgi:peroxiredoxin
MTADDFHDLMQVLARTLTQDGERLASLSEKSLVLLVFLRHAGCMFCREALGDIARARGAIQGSGARIVLVHMGDSAAIEKLLTKYGISGLDRICDPARELYRAFGLQRGSLRQLFGPSVARRAIGEGVLWEYGAGFPAADSFQMAGLFLIGGAGIMRRYRHRTIADRPDYAAICEVPIRSAEAR